MRGLPSALGRHSRGLSRISFDAKQCSPERTNRHRLPPGCRSTTVRREPMLRTPASGKHQGVSPRCQTPQFISPMVAVAAYPGVTIVTGIKLLANGGSSQPVQPSRSHGQRHRLLGLGNAALRKPGRFGRPTRFLWSENPLSQLAVRADPLVKTIRSMILCTH